MGKKLEWRQMAAIALTVVFFLFQIYLALIKQLPTMLQAPLHLLFALALVYLYNPPDKKYRKKLQKEKGETVSAQELNKFAWSRWIDILVAVGIVFQLWYVVNRYQSLVDHVLFISPVDSIDIAFMVITAVLLLEAVRRTLGGILFGFILLFIIYAWTAQYLPGILYTRGKPFAAMLKQFTEGMTMSTSGIFGSPLQTSANSLFYFIVFGAFFSAFGGGQLLIDIGMKASNKGSGGPAKAAVISSGLMGMISGSAVANVSTTGVLTIPLMKKAGYTPEEAGAVESVASTGGQIMPPIMGAGAFIMAEMIGIPYMDIATAAILPAVAYFGAVFILVHLLAKKKQMSTTNDALKYQGSPILPRVYRLVPIILLVIMIFAGMSMPRAAIYCTALSIILCMLSKDTRMSARQLMETLIEGVRQAANVAIPTAACGIMIGIVVRSGVAVKVAKLIGTSGNNSLLLALVVAAVGCLMLGMALPTVAAYLIANTLFCSAIQGLGIEALVANMFIFYFGVVAQITPPVCLASFTAAGIANASAWKTGWKAFFFAITAFIAPFMFVYRPSILLIGTVTEILISCAMTACATFFLAAGVAGYMGKNLSAAERVLFFAAALMFIMPGRMFDLIGIVMGVVLVVWCLIFSRRQNTAAV